MPSNELLFWAFGISAHPWDSVRQGQSLGSMQLAICLITIYDAEEERIQSDT